MASYHPLDIADRAERSTNDASSERSWKSRSSARSRGSAARARSAKKSASSCFPRLSCGGACLLATSMLFAFSAGCVLLYIKLFPIEKVHGFKINFARPRFTDSANLTVVISPNVYGTWSGWGTSLCWWANVFGQRDDLADLFFTLRDDVVLDDLPSAGALPGLGLTVARYNAGAHGRRHVDGLGAMQTSPNVPPFKQMETFWQDPGSADVNSPSWNWTVDQNQITMLQKARDRGADRFELFSNSPVWWMLYNLNPAGRGTSDNLRAGAALVHAMYLAKVAKRASDFWGIDFATVSPMNEATAPWWIPDGTQEGCHFSRGAKDQAAVLLQRALELEGFSAKGIDASGTLNQPSPVIAAFDENSYDDALRAWTMMSTAAKQFVGQVNVHGYQQQGGHRLELYEAVRDERNARRRRISAQGRLRAQTDAKDIDNALDAGHGTSEDGAPLEATTAAAIGSTFSTRAPLELELWNSEYGDGDGSGVSLAANLNLDLFLLHPSGWVYWQMLDATSGWGMLEFDPGGLGLPQEQPPKKLHGSPRVTRVNDKLFVLAHYSRHLRPGMSILGTSDLDTVAAYDTKQRKLVLVATNYGVARFMTFDLSQFSSCNGPVTRWVSAASFDPTANPRSPFTRAPRSAAGTKAATKPLESNTNVSSSAADESECCYVKHVGDIVIGYDKTFTLWFGTNTTMTIEVENVNS